MTLYIKYIQNAFNCPKWCECFTYVYACIGQAIHRLYTARDPRWHHMGLMNAQLMQVLTWHSIIQGEWGLWCLPQIYFKGMINVSIWFPCVFILRDKVCVWVLMKGSSKCPLRSLLTWNRTKCWGLYFLIKCNQWYQFVKSNYFATFSVFSFSQL